jgi:hypothetical protein
MADQIKMLSDTRKELLDIVKQVKSMDRDVVIDHIIRVGEVEDILTLTITAYEYEDSRYLLPTD